MRKARFSSDEYFDISDLKQAANAFPFATRRRVVFRFGEARSRRVPAALYVGKNARRFYREEAQGSSRRNVANSLDWTDLKTRRAGLRAPNVKKRVERFNVRLAKQSNQSVYNHNATSRFLLLFIVFYENHAKTNIVATGIRVRPKPRRASFFVF